MMNEQKKGKIIPQDSKRVFVGLTLNQRLPLVILLALTFSLTIMVFTPLDLFANNREEFPFVLFDFFGWNLLWTFITSIVIVGVLLPMRGRLFNAFYLLGFGGTLMLYIQGGFLSVGLSSVAGDGVGGGMPSKQLLLNAGIWIIVFLALLVITFLTRLSFGENFRLFFLVALITVLGMQTVNATITLFTRDVFSPYVETQVESGNSNEELQQKFLSYKNFNELAQSNNVFYFVVDRFDAEYWEAALESMPEIAESLDGFTYYDDATSLYPRTFPSVTYMVTGKENDFSKSRADYLNSAYDDSVFLKRLSDNGYTINIYTDSYTGYDNASYMEDYIENAAVLSGYDVREPSHLSWDFIRLSLYRHLPFAINHITGQISTTHFSSHTVLTLDNVPKYSTDMKDAYEHVLNHPIEVGEGDKNFSFIHIAGTHLPNAYDKNFNPITDGSHPEYNDVASSITQSFKIISMYIKQLKELGLYDDATIIITGDHASIGSDSEVPIFYTPI